MFSWALQEVVGPSDDALVTVPNFQSVEALPLEAGAHVGAIPLRACEGWWRNLNEAEAALTHDTRLIAVNFPNYPTGAVPDRETFAALAALCDARSIPLFSDEGAVRRDGSLIACEGEGPVLNAAPEGTTILRDDDDDFFDWIKARPEGFFVNTERSPKPTYLVLR